jgi:ArsR family transcriptional regulator
MTISEASPDCPPPTKEFALPASVEARNDALASLAKALGHPVRVAIIRRLGSVDACVSDIVEALPLAQSTVSQHLKILKAAGLVRGDVKGPKVCYCLEPSAVHHLRALLEEL